jgi:hypothetical protein
MPLYSGKDRLVLARGEGSGWVKERALKNTNTWLITRFIFKDIIYKYRVFLELVIDREPENNNTIIKELIIIYGIRYIITFAFNPLANKIIKRGYKPIIITLTKATKDNINNWVFYLLAMLWAN